MAPYIAPSILRGIEQGDVESLRRLMIALLKRDAGVPEATVALDLIGNETIAFVRIYNTATGTADQLLRQMMRRFAFAQFGSASVILQAAADFDRVAVEVVQDPMTGTAAQLERARLNFRQLVQAGQFVYDRDGVNEFGEPVANPNNDVRESEESDDDVHYEYPLKYTTKKRKKSQTLDDEEESDQEEEKKSKKVMKSAKNAKHFESSHVKPKNAPVRPANTRCINDGSLDRKPAIVGKRDDSKLSMTFQLEEENPPKSGNWARAGSATYTYRPAVDWTDKASIQRLNSWRGGNFNRQIGAKGEPRHLWLESERDELIKILTRHLATSAVRGRWSYLNWEDITTKYNAAMNGVVQKVGERTAARFYGPNDGRGKPTSSTQTIKKARDAPHRTEQALRNQLSMFLDKRAQKLIADAKKADVEDEEGDDDEAVEYGTTSKQNKGKAPAIRKHKYKVKSAERVVEEEYGEGEVIEEEAEEDVDQDEAFNKRMEEALKRSRQEKERKDRDDRNNGSSSSQAGSYSSLA